MSGKVGGKCWRCGREFVYDNPKEIAYCDCWKYCDKCGGELRPPSQFETETGPEVTGYCPECDRYSLRLPVEVKLRAIKGGVGVKH